MRNFNPRTPVGCDQTQRIRSGQVSYFNPRTPVGCDISSLLHSPFSLLFQSTHPSGVRRGHAQRSARPRPISIHAPQWGATSPPNRHARTQRNFNPRTPVGCDRRWLEPHLQQHHFNPRTPVGCDHHASRPPQRLRISIHAPQWGATKPDELVLFCSPISIHAPQWGATQRLQRFGHRQ